MSRPICEHGPPRRWKPERMIQWEGERGAQHNNRRCPSFLLHKSKQCTQPGRANHPYYCENHKSPVESYGDQCLQCIALRKSQALAYKNGQTAEAQAVRDEKLIDLAISKRITLRAAILRILGNDDVAFAALMGAQEAGEKMIEDGKVATGRGILEKAQAGFMVTLFEAIQAEGAS